MNPVKRQMDLLIVGAGPAGLSAASVAAEMGMRVAVVDEFPLAGGRMLGQFHQEPRKAMWVGKQIAEELIAGNEQLGVTTLCGVSVYGMQQTDDKLWEI